MYYKLFFMFMFIALALGATLAVGCTTVRVSAKDQQTGSISVKVSPDIPVNVTVHTDGSLNPNIGLKND